MRKTASGMENAHDAEDRIKKYCISEQGADR